MTTTSEDLSIFQAFIQKKFRAVAKILLKFWLFSMIIGLELVLQFGLLLILIGLCLWVLILIILTSPLWIPLSILWAPAAIITFLAFKFTNVIYIKQAHFQIIAWVQGIFCTRETYLPFNVSFYMAKKNSMEKLLQPDVLVSVQNYNQMYLNGDEYITSLNCGYAILTQTGETLKLVARRDKKQQFQFQMYHYAALGIKNNEELAGQIILDLGCGRGGGLTFLTKYFNPKLAVGVDISCKQINFCKNNLNNQIQDDGKNEFENLQFEQGDSENLMQIQSVANQKFDIVTCVESLHCNSNIKAVLNGVSQLLNIDGNFIIADIFDKNEITAIERQFQQHFDIERKELLTINVKHAMNLDKDRIEKIVTNLSANTFIQKILRNLFASAEGSNTYNQLGKTKEYICYVLKKRKNCDTTNKNNFQDTPNSTRRDRSDSIGSNLHYRNQNHQSNSSIQDNDPQNSQQSI